MKKKNGFTLIELLAVITVLTIIVLITAPVVINIIKDARKKAAQDSAYGIRESAQFYYQKLVIDNMNGFNDVLIKFDKKDGKGIYYVSASTNEEKANSQLQLNNSGFNIEGTIPTGGTLKVSSNGNIESLSDLIIDGYYCHIPNTGKITCETNWTPIEYTITYNLDGGTNAINNPSTYQVDTETITLAEPTKNGYTFNGWSVTGLTGDANTEVTILQGSTENKMYTANWTPIEYTITYNLDGGTVTNPTTYTIESDDITLNNPSKATYYFTGWIGSNGSTPQTDVVIPKGSIGNKTFTANYAQYSSASLRTFNPGDVNVSWTFNSSTGIYSITQRAGSSGWGQGVVCDDSTTSINWGQTYMLEFEIKVPSTYTLKTDGNTMFVSDGSGNDIYGTSWLVVDDVRIDGNGYGKLPQSTVINGGTWHKVKMYLINNNTTENSSHKAIKSYSGFALDLSSVTSNVTYQMRNLKSIVY